jgi:hypothetical protein
MEKAMRTTALGFILDSCQDIKIILVKILNQRRI